MKNLNKIAIISISTFLILIATIEIIFNIKLSQINETIYSIFVVIINLFNVSFIWQLNDKEDLKEYKNEEEKEKCMELKICSVIAMVLSILYIVFSNYYIAIFLLVFYIITATTLLDLIKNLFKGKEQ